LRSPVRSLSLEVWLAETLEKKESPASCAMLIVLLGVPLADSLCAAKSSRWMSASRFTALAGMLQEPGIPNAIVVCLSSCVSIVRTWPAQHGADRATVEQVRHRACSAPPSKAPKRHLRLTGRVVQRFKRCSMRVSAPQSFIRLRRKPLRARLARAPLPD